MNKKIVITTAVIVIILIGVVGYVLSQKKAPVAATNTATPQAMKEEPTGAMPDFVKAMQGSGSVKCTYDVNGVMQTSYIKDGKIRMQITSHGVANNTLMINKVVYSWADNSRTGFMMDTSTLKTTITPATGTPAVKDMDTVKKDMETYKPTCTNETIADSMFEKPTDVTFSDTSKMMDEIKAKIPANVTIPAGYKVPQQ